MHRARRGDDATNGQRLAKGGTPVQTITPQYCLQHLLEHLEQQSVLERRETPRYRIHAPIEISFAEPGGALHRCQGWAQEVSPDGLGWLMIEPLAIGIHA